MHACLRMFLAAAFLALGSASVSAQSFPAWGGPGDAQVSDLCGQQQYFITGFKFRSGAWLDQVQIVCQRHNVDGTVDPARITPTPARGGGGGAPGEIYCPPNQIVTRIDPALTPERQIRGFTFNCGSYVPGKQVQQGETWQVGAFYNSHKDDTRAQLCEVFDYNAGLGMHINFGKHVNGVGLVCNKVVRSGDKPPVGLGLPPPGGSASGPWLAIAANDKGIWGFAKGQGSEQQARTNALAGCGPRSNGCSVKAAVQAKCFAYAEFKTGGYWYGIGYSSDVGNASRIAKEICGGKPAVRACTVVKSTC